MKPPVQISTRGRIAAYGFRGKVGSEQRLPKDTLLYRMPMCIWSNLASHKLYQGPDFQLGQQYKTAATGGVIEPTPYTTRHKLLSDLKRLTDGVGVPLLSREDLARKAGHASTASQAGYG